MVSEIRLYKLLKARGSTLFYIDIIVVIITRSGTTNQGQSAHHLSQESSADRRCKVSLL